MDRSMEAIDPIRILAISRILFPYVFLWNLLCPEVQGGDLFLSGKSRYEVWWSDGGKQNEDTPKYSSEIFATDLAFRQGHYI